MEEQNRARSRKKQYRRRRLKKPLWKTLFAGVILAAAVACACYAFLAWRSTFEKKPPRESPVTVPLETMGEVRAPGSEALPGAEDLLTNMTTEEKILQMFVITPEALTGVAGVNAAGEKTKEAYFQYPVGGLVYFKDNLRSPGQVREMLANTYDYSVERLGIPVFISVDEEGGTVARVGGREEFGLPPIEDMADVGALGDTERAYEIGREIGAYLSHLGFNLDYAPVADAVTNPENQVVARRAFGTEGQTVAAFSNQVVKGLQEQGVSATLKHFPGHGGTQGDTHNGYAYTEKNLDQLMENELIPFREGIKAGADFVMVGHIAAPNVTGDELPSSLSKIMVTDVLREQLGFEKIIITDALDMEAISASYSSADAAVMAVEAGVDMLLMPQNFEEAYQGLLSAVKSGRISEERIDQSALRILKVKEKKRKSQN